MAYSWANATSYYLGHDKHVKQVADLGWQWQTSLDYKETIQKTNELLPDYCAIEIILTMTL